LVRASFLSLRERDFVTAARASGAGSSRLIFRHILPNALAPVIVAASFGMAQAILLEAGLSFLGLGVQPPTPSWGNMLTDAQSISVLRSMPWLWLPPGAMIALTVLSINFIGDGLRDAFDPRAIR
jgi:peptide/nickel transport system permease protein